MDRRVYPRVCGGTVPTAFSMMRARGLSPRVRGNPIRKIHRMMNQRSIPRVCGGT